MTDRALFQQALEALDWLRHHLTQHHGCLHMDPTASGIPAWLGKTEAALRERVAQIEKEWRGLTDEEIADVWNGQTCHITDLTLATDFVRDIEDKLRSKNT